MVTVDLWSEQASTSSVFLYSRNAIKAASVWQLQFQIVTDE